MQCVGAPPETNLKQVRLSKGAWSYTVENPCQAVPLWAASVKVDDV
ncbi:MAG TPA: hypothetical protein VN714_31980 [Trebonia sp.]|nr:hypothetical protein [Trebonia sp.]